MGIVPPKLLPIFPRPRTSQDPKEDHPSTYGTLARADDADEFEGVFPVHYESPVVTALPISPYTGQPYDPAWATRRH